MADGGGVASIPYFSLAQASIHSRRHVRFLVGALRSRPSPTFLVMELLRRSMAWDPDPFQAVKTNRTQSSTDWH
jgi:hypothetical protein